MDVFFKIIAVLLLVFLNGYFVASEFALVAVRKTRIDELVKKKNTRAKLLQNAVIHLDNYISATQLGITIASIALGWIGEPALAHVLEPLFSFLPHDAAFITAHSAAVAIAFALITFLHIVLGELAPKSLALQRTEATALVIITPLVFFAKVFKPFIWLLNEAGNLILKAFGLHTAQDQQSIFSEDEIKMILAQSSQRGVIASTEAEMVYNVFSLGDIPVKFIMIPRTDIVAFNVKSTLKEVASIIQHEHHSRFPVYEYSIDNVIGFIHIKDIYREMLEKKDTTQLSELDIIRDIIHVPEVKKIDKVLTDMRRKRIHLGVVNDEFGGVAGIVTLEDVIESLVGEIEDEFDEPVQEIIKQKDGSYLVEGHAPIEDIQEKFKLPLKGQGYTTIGGLVFGLLGHEPRVKDVVQIGDISFTVEQIEGKRIRLIKLVKTSSENKEKKAE